MVFCFLLLLSLSRYLNYGDAFGDELLPWSYQYKRLMEAFQSIGFTIEVFKLNIQHYSIIIYSAFDSI